MRRVVSASHGSPRQQKASPRRERLPLSVAILASLLLASCGSAPATPAPALVGASPLATTSLRVETTVASATPVPTATQTATSEPTSTPLRIAIPTFVLTPSITWPPPPYQAPRAVRPGDHFYFGRPIPTGGLIWVNPDYRYGNTYFGEETIHTGIDLAADLDTPVLAAGDGEVVWAGYGLYRGYYTESDPYGLAIAIRHDFGYDDQELYTIYGHLGQISVWLGQRVETGEQIGVVGETGHTTGPHLHFEVRLGANRYFHTRNPELWMVPLEGSGVLAGRVMDTWGRRLPEHQVIIRSLLTSQQWIVYTYAQVTVWPDDSYDENFAIGDLPEGPYEVRIDVAGRAFRANLYLHPGQTNFFVFQGRSGFQVEPTAGPLASIATPRFP